MTGGLSGSRAGGLAAARSARLTRLDYPAWERQVARVGGCANPVRVRGAAHAVDLRTGEVLASFSSATQPDGTLLIACGDRRASVCPSCAEAYRRDSWYLVAAGLRGGGLAVERPTSRGVTAAGHLPADLSEHPMMWATLTAPSFGAVHRAGGWCRPRRAGGYCEHGNGLGCGRTHEATDSAVGSPLCPECYDYRRAVVWNAVVPELWRRTVIYTYRAAARLASGLTREHLTAHTVRRWLRLAYVRVVEWQRRGVIHVHLAARLDGVGADDRGRVVPPPAWASVELLMDAFAMAVEEVSVPLPVPPAAVWGEQLDLQAVTPEEAESRAAYIAKYATKAAGDVLGGLPARPLRDIDVTVLRSGHGSASDHVRALALTCVQLADDPAFTGMRLWENAHQAGYRGHYMTRSRWWSTTRRNLHAARRTWAARNANAGDPWAMAATGDRGAVVGDWSYAGSGYSLADAEIVERLVAGWAAMRDEISTGNAGTVRRSATA